MPTIRDIAKRAAVSVGTVSNALNNPDSVSPATLARVRAVMDDLNYLPNRLARFLRAGRSPIVGFVVVDITHPFTPEVARGAGEAIENRGLMMAVCNTGEDSSREDRWLEALAEQRVAGVVITPVNREDPLVAPLERGGIPVVFLDAPVPEDIGSFCAARADDRQGGAIALSHLAELGHQKLVMLNGPDWMRQCRDREEGARSVVDGSMTLEVIQLVELSVQEGERAANELLKRPDLPSGIFCAQDMVAVGVERVLLANGIRIPQDVSIVGYDDIDLAETTAIPLTTVKKPRYEMGKRAAELLLDEIFNTENHRHLDACLEPELLVRASTARLAR